eukprot:TRINITY_DN10118_c0_g2_i1.p1 TRINITY_DN10118_c0_g2~~TRINITY_DN10118_c0_g2_i1.p1  ORF type:complete len:918 (-),score=294.37 TRINITY_DN10118_c0_g2_i1:127-2880(-)
MLKDEIQVNITSITMMKDMLKNSQGKMATLVAFMQKFFNAYKTLAEELSNSESEAIAKQKHRLSPLGKLVDTTVKFLYSTREGYVARLKSVVESTASKKQQIDQSYSELQADLEKVLTSLKGLLQLYDSEYVPNVDNLSKIQREIKRLEEAEATKDSFEQYVISIKEETKKKKKKLAELEQTVKHKLNMTARDINRELGKINKVLLNLPSTYAGTLSKVMKTFWGVLFLVTIVDNTRMPNHLAPLASEVQTVLNITKEDVKYETPHIASIMEENSELSGFLFRYILRFKESTDSIYSKLDSYLSEYDQNKSEAQLAVLNEWKEQLENYIKGKISFQKKLCLHIGIALKSKLELAFEGLTQSKNELKKHPNISSLKIKDVEMFKQIADCINGLLQYLFSTLSHSFIQTDEYVKLLKTATADFSDLQNLINLKSITLLCSQDESVNELKDELEESKSPRREEAKFMFKVFKVNEPSVETYICALHWKILLQGRLYVTRSYLCFQSGFNKDTLFGKETKICIPFCDVVEINKTHNALIFDNSIIVKTGDTEFFFTSFLSRDRAYKLIKSLHEGVEKPNVEFKNLEVAPLLENAKRSNSKEEQFEVSEEDASFLGKIKEIESERLEKAEKDLGLLMPTSKAYLNDTYDCPIQLLLTAIIDRTNPTYLNVLTQSCNKDLVVEEVTPVPEYYVKFKYSLNEMMKGEQKEKDEFLEKARKWPLTSKSKARYKHFLDFTVPIPFFPKEFSMKEDATIYYLSPNHVIMQIRIDEKGFPYDSHVFTYQWIKVVQIVENGKCKTNLKIFVENKFVKSTVFQSIIDKTAVDTIISTLDTVTRPLYKEHVEKQFAKYWKFLENKGMNSYEICLWTPKLNESAIGKVMCKEFQKGAMYVKGINHILANQKKMYMVSLAIGILLIALVIIYK